ncbi:brachyurin-like isoform X2 [Agrilus planipennis]|uniref:Brachyurin-like isoform X2 n=1 Tax=Agrilus planipennis TaxID=224129 RepID=A0A1W4X7M4_AGRPL|nr:brachyurin-like isoform X2 [Agrilus planipennis]
MKEIVLIFLIFSLVAADRDWYKIIPAHSKDSTSLHQLASSEDVRIVGGSEAAPNSLPYQAALSLIFNGTSGFCGGSLITRRYVLTAAHCLVNELVSVVVVLGAHNITFRETTQQRIRTSTFKVHEEFNNETLENDLGIVYLPTPAKLNRYVQLIALPTRDDADNDFVGSEAITSGWGYNTTSATDISHVLQYVKVPIIENDVCNATLADITDSMICTGGSGNKGICFGDSGGPLVIKGKLVGVTSFIGDNGCDAGEPNAFSRVTSFLDWISENSDAVIR